MKNVFGSRTLEYWAGCAQQQCVLPWQGKSLPDPNENLLASLCCILTSTSPVINEGRQADNAILCKTEGGTEGGGNHGEYFQNEKKKRKLWKAIKYHFGSVLWWKGGNTHSTERTTASSSLTSCLARRSYGLIPTKSHRSAEHRRNRFININRHCPGNSARRRRDLQPYRSCKRCNCSSLSTDCRNSVNSVKLHVTS